jgi:NAD(P)-dependent dehydrogenase (short-subunit alcohol dehydrogenase family)
MSQHPALTESRVAVVTGAASGIGLAAALRFAAMGLRVCLSDLAGETLEQAAEKVAAAARRGKSDVMAVPADVSDHQAVDRLKDAVYQRFGEVALLMNNAGTSPGGGPWDHYERWRRVLDVNLWGVINGVHAFTPAMIEQRTPCAIVNTGSKQGITCPPGDTAYNVSKAGIKVLTEGLQHTLRNTAGCQVSAHLLVPGSTFTGMTARRGAEKPAGAWWPAEVADFMLERMAAGDFYILCPDNDVTRAMDNARMTWAMQDLTCNRPPLSRWHPDYEHAFAEFLAKETGRG